MESVFLRGYDDYLRYTYETQRRIDAEFERQREEEEEDEFERLSKA